MNLTRLDLAEQGPVLATRELGRQVGQDLQDKLADANSLVLNFAGVDVASPPFLDEVMRAAQVPLFGRDANRLLVAAGFNEDVRESLEWVLERHKLALAALDEGQIELLGGTRQLQETLREAQQLGDFTAPELAERLKVKLPNLHARLKSLTESGALARHEDETAERGRRHRYHAPSPEELGAGAITTSA